MRKNFRDIDSNSKREEVLKFIKEHPSESISKMAQLFKIKEGTIRAWKAHQTRGTYALKSAQKKSQKPKNKKPLGKTRANELDGKTWLKYSISVWNDIKKTAEEIKLNHPAMFPVQLPKRLIEIYTNKEMKVVLDPFMGSGSTLIAAMELNKQGIGFEISAEYVKLAKNRLRVLKLFSNNIPPQIFQEDARNLLNYLKPESVDICITSPPYWDILSEKRTADNKEIKDYQEKANNLSTIKDYNKFLEELCKIFEKVFIVLKPGTYCCVDLMDIRKKNKFYPFHSDLASYMEKIGFILDDIIIWDRRQEYNNLRPLGYPFKFRINRIHEYILIFQKPSK